MSPCDHLAVLVEPRFEALDRHCVEEVVVDVVLANRHDLDRRSADRLGTQSRLDREVRLRLAAKASAQKGHVDRDVLGLKPQI